MHDSPQKIPRYAYSMYQDVTLPRISLPTPTCVACAYYNAIRSTLVSQSDILFTTSFAVFLSCFANGVEQKKMLWREDKND